MKGSLSESTFVIRHSPLIRMTSVRSAILLTFFGILAVAFFWFTDPTLGVADHLMDSHINRLDAANQAWPGTLMGLAGSAVVTLTGLWLMTKRSA